ncbi:MAG: anti-sigma factor family protein [bacterium]|jgi:anti-sigma factor RsiW
MSCASIQNSLSAYLDQCLDHGEYNQMTAHLSVCPSCSGRLRQLVRVRTMLSNLPAVAPPPGLTASLRVLASRERANRIARKNLPAYWANRLRLWADNLMRPMALPFAGGLVSALALFGMLAPSVGYRVHASLDDVPIPFFYTGPKVKEQAPYEFSCATDVVLEVVVDKKGRAVDYKLPEGASLTAQQRRRIATNLLFTQFTPATAYGRPTTAKMFLSFTHTRFEVPSKS